MPVLSLALVALLAAADAAPRVPGTRFRLGMTSGEIARIGAYPELKATDAPGLTARQGASRFFGIPGELTLYLREGRLARLRFVATGVSPHSAGYAEDQLRRMGIAPQCRRDLPRDRSCDWHTAALTLRLEIRDDRLEVRADHWPLPAWAAADTGRAGMVAAGRTAPRPAARRAEEGAAPDTARGPGAGAASDTARGQSATAARDTSGRARQAAATTDPTTGGPAGTAAATTPAQDTGGASGTAQGAGSSAPTAGTARSTASRDASGLPGSFDTTPSILLPDTLSISLAGRNSPDVWPRILSSPTLEYPEAARAQSVQGVVWVLAFVEWDGKVIDARVDRGIPELDAAALAWVTRSRFAPCTLRGDPCRFYVRVAVLFTLH